MALIKLGLVGVGKIAADQHLPSIRETGLFDLVGVVSRRGASLGGAPSSPTIEAMLAAQPGITAVAICTPPEGRHAYVRAALDAGLHVLMEKPPTASVSELEDLIEAAGRAGKALFATWHSQFNPAVDAARRRLAAATIRSIEVTWKEDVRRWHPGQDWVFEPGGFGVFDPGINALSILTKVLPFPTFVTSATLAFPANRDTPIAADLVLGAPAAAGVERYVAAFDWRQEGEQTWTIAIETTDGTALELTRGGTCLSVDGVTLVDEPDKEYRHIYRRFADLIASAAIDVDAAPLRIVADCFLKGRRREVAAFDW